jgi:hypothetical protein
MVNLIDVVRMSFMLILVRKLKVSIQIVTNLVIVLKTKVIQSQLRDYFTFHKINAHIDKLHFDHL